MGWLRDILDTTAFRYLDGGLSYQGLVPHVANINHSSHHCVFIFIFTCDIVCFILAYFRDCIFALQDELARLSRVSLQLAVSLRSPS